MNTHRIEFFREALLICERHGRSPEAALVVGGQALPLRHLLKTIGNGARVPRITETEARRLARENEKFSYRAILSGLGGRRPAARRSGQGRSRRSRRAVQ